MQTQHTGILYNGWMKQPIQYIRLKIKDSLQLIQAIFRRYTALPIIVVCLLFLGFLSAFILPNDIKLEQLIAIMDKYAEIGKSSHPEFIAIFLNNLYAATITIIFGFLLIVPIVTAFFMGFTIGIFLDMFHRLSIISGQDFLFSSLVALIPHGIIEIPAVLLSVMLSLSWGLKLFSKRALLSQITRKEFTKKIFLTYILICIPMLFFAAIIESTITPFLIERTSAPLEAKTPPPVSSSCIVQRADLQGIEKNVIEENATVREGFVETQSLAILLYDDTTFTSLKQTKALGTTTKKFIFSKDTDATLSVAKYRSEEEAKKQIQLYEHILNLMEKHDPTIKTRKENNVYTIQKKDKYILETFAQKNQYMYALQYAKDDKEVFKKIVELQEKKIESCI